MAESVAPPPGFELEATAPAPPPGFVLEKAQAKAEAPKENEPGLMRKALDIAKGIPIPMMGVARGAAMGSRFGPYGTLAGGVLGGGGGEALNQFLGLTPDSKLSILLSAIAGPMGKTVKPVAQLAADQSIAAFGSRSLVGEAAESLLKKWISPETTAKELYAAAEATRKVIPAGTTARAVDDLLKNEVNRMPLAQQKELLDTLGPLKDFVTIGRGRGFQMIRSQNVADAMADVRRLGLESRRAFKADNSDLGNAVNKVRAALLDDLEKAGVPEVKLASRAYRKEMALEDLGRMISKSEPGTKIKDFARDNPLFKGAFDETEMALIQKITDKVRFVVPTGMAGAAGRVITGGAGALATGSPWGALLAWAGPEAIRKGLASPKGRAFIEHSLASPYQMGPEWAAAAAMFFKGLAGGYLNQQEQTQ